MLIKLILLTGLMQLHERFFSKRFIKEISTVNKILIRIVEIGNSLAEGMPHFESTLLYCYMQVIH